MAKMSCFSILLTGRRQKRVQVGDAGKGAGTGNESPRAKPVAVESTDALPQPVAAAVVDKCGDKIVADVVIVVAHKAGEASPVKRDSLSDDFEFDFHPHPIKPVVSDVHGVDKQPLGTVPDAPVVTSGGEEAAAVEVDPSAKLKRSCSNIETKRTGPRDAPGMPVRSRSSGDLPGDLFVVTTPRRAHEASPDASVKTSRTADGVMLKRRSSSQVLPSRSRKLWWRLFMWSHRNLHRPGAATTPIAMPRGGTAHQMFHSNHRQQHDGYTSDTLGNCKDKEIAAVEEEPACPNQWVAFSAEASSPLDRVSAWVSSLGDGSLIHAADEEDEDGITETEIGEPSGTKGHAQAQAQTRHNRRSRAADEAVQQASSIVQTLNALSSVAHISGMGLKAVPMISAFSSLRAVNLSGNFIAHIPAGSLPKGLHTLDLSRNSIATIEGLRELTRLRVLSLSYNRIARIGHGLSSCTAIRELYLAGNKMSDVEGLHRLLKLAVLDLSFNKITTTKGLGQLVANYNSLRALNLLGNPVQANVGDDALRKAVSGLLPLLEYLSKQALKPQRAREAVKDSVAKAALGNNRWSSRRRPGSAARRLGQSPGARSWDRDGSSRSRSQSQSRVQARR